MTETDMLSSMWRLVSFCTKQRHWECQWKSQVWGVPAIDQDDIVTEWDAEVLTQSAQRPGHPLGRVKPQEQRAKPRLERPWVFRGKHFRQRMWIWVYDTEFWSGRTPRLGFRGNHFLWGLALLTDRSDKASGLVSWGAGVSVFSDHK